jgi:hypothetical protein
MLQFSNKGNFSLPAGVMTIRGRYLAPESQYVTGGIRVFFGGLEFNLREERGKGLSLAGAGGVITAVNPESLIIDGNTARLILPGGTSLVFNSSESVRGYELQINAVFADNISEISIPVHPRRSSIIRDNGQLGILYGGNRYFFGGQGQELDSRILVLSRGNSFVSYRSRGRQQVFDPANFIIDQAHNYDNAVLSWRDSSFNHWRQNAPSLQNEDDIAAFCGEALRHGLYISAVASISNEFLNSNRLTHRSSVFLGGKTAGFNTFIAAENEKFNLVTRLTRERSLDVFKEEYIIDFLFTRSNNALAYDVIDIIRNLSPERLIPDHCAGLLEAYSDIRRWQPTADNPVEPLIEQILLLISGTLSRDTENDLVFSSGAESRGLEYSLRLGKALIYWADSVNNTEWAAIGRSLVLSALASGGAGAGNLYSILSPGEYYPRAAWLMENGHWAWTVSPSVRANFNSEGNLNVAVSFPVNMSHYIMIRGVRPFLRLQIHGQDWRTSSQFERYDSSGWVYHPEEQTLILKLRHRTPVENVLIVYTAPPPPPPPPVVIEYEGDNETNEVIYE